MSHSDSTPSTQSFLLRLHCVTDFGAPQWRFTIKSVSTGRDVVLHSAEDVLTFLHERMDNSSRHFNRDKNQLP